MVNFTSANISIGNWFTNQWFISRLFQYSVNSTLFCHNIVITQLCIYLRANCIQFNSINYILNVLSNAFTIYRHNGKLFQGDTCLPNLKAMMYIIMQHSTIMHELGRRLILVLRLSQST